MDFGQRALSFFRQTVSYSRIDSGEISVEEVCDFTLPNAEKTQLVHAIKGGNIKLIRIYLKDLYILKQNVSYLTESLIDLRVRPRVTQSETGGGENADKQKQGQKKHLNDFEMLSYESEDFIECLPRFQNLKSISFDNGGNIANGILNSIAQLKNLRILTLQDCGFRNIDLDMVSTLKHIDFSCNNLSAFPIKILQLKQLQSLNLSKNFIRELPEKINELQKLTKLDVSDNKLTKLPESILTLRLLLKLYLFGNEIQCLPSRIGEMTSLRYLDLRENNITCLPDSIGDLYQLIKLNLCNNKITALPEAICDLQIGDDALLLSGNPIQLPPAEVCIQGRQSMKGFFDALNQSSDYVKTKRLKLVLLGESFAGKSSLASALVYARDANIKPDKRTVGVDYYTWKPRPHEQDNGLEILLVDCAGQRKYLLTHQFFFTEGALFVIVMDLSKYQMTELDYRVMVGDWINLVISQVPGATILIVPNHLDVCVENGIDHLSRCRDLVRRLVKEEQERIELLAKEVQSIKLDPTNFRRIESLVHLQKTRPNFSTLIFSEKDFDYASFGSKDISLVPVCCKYDLDGVAALRREILRIVDNEALCPLVSRTVPESWVAFEQKIWRLRNEGDIPFISKDSLSEITAIRDTLSLEMFHSALDYFNAIGSIAYFKNVQRASHLVFLNPEWLIKLLHLLFRHDHENTLIYDADFLGKVHIFEAQFDQDKEMFLRKGRLSESLLRCIWLRMFNEKDLNNLLPQIVDILQHFGILCQLPNASLSEEVTYFIPWFIAEKEPFEVSEKWKQDEQPQIRNVVTRMDTSIARLPDSVVHRLLVYVQAKSELCIPWKTGFLFIKPRCKLLCNVISGNNSSIVILHGRCGNNYLRDVWELMLDIWKEFQMLIDEWNGIVSYESFSICPLCVQRNTPKPYIFRANWINVHDSTEKYSCLKCNDFVDASVICPPKDLVKEMLSCFEPEGNPSIRKKTEPLSDRELSDVAEMIGTAHTRLASLLGIKQNVIQVIQYEYKSPYEQAVQILHKWKHQKGKADRLILINAIKELDDQRLDLMQFLESGEKP